MGEHANTRGRWKPWAFVALAIMCCFVPAAIGSLHPALCALYLTLTVVLFLRVFSGWFSHPQMPGWGNRAKSRRLMRKPSPDPFSDEQVQVEVPVPPSFWSAGLWLTPALILLMALVALLLPRISHPAASSFNATFLLGGLLLLAIARTSVELGKYFRAEDLYHEDLERLNAEQSQHPPLPGPQPPAPLKQRMARYLHCDQEALGQPSNEPPKSRMPFWSAVRLRQYRRRRIKSEWWIRTLLLHIQKLVHGS